MSKTITQCSCGSTEFYIKESLWHVAEVDSGSLLTVYKDRDNGIDLIECKKCEKEYSEENFNQIDF